MKKKINISILVSAAVALVLFFALNQEQSHVPYSAEVITILEPVVPVMIQKTFGENRYALTRLEELGFTSFTHLEARYEGK